MIKVNDYYFPSIYFSLNVIPAWLLFNEIVQIYIVNGEAPPHGLLSNRKYSKLFIIND